MGFQRKLAIVVSGEVEQATLEQLRADLSLRQRGRLTDYEDVEFGYRRVRFRGDGQPEEPPVDLSQPIQNLIIISLSRLDPETWAFGISYIGEPPPEDFVDDYRARFLATAERVGLVVIQESRTSPSGGPPGAAGA